MASIFPCKEQTAAFSNFRSIACKQAFKFSNTHSYRLHGKIKDIFHDNGIDSRTARSESDNHARQ